MRSHICCLSVSTIVGDLELVLECIKVICAGSCHGHEAFLAFWTSNGCNKFAPFAVFLVCSRFKQQAIEKPIGECN